MLCKVGVLLKSLFVDMTVLFQAFIDFMKLRNQLFIQSDLSVNSQAMKNQDITDLLGTS